MPIRPRLFLNFLAICLAPLFLLSLVNYWHGLWIAEDAVEREHETELRQFSQVVTQLLNEDKEQLVTVSRSKALADFVEKHNQSHSSSLLPTSVLSVEQDAASALPIEMKFLLADALDRRSHFASLSAFDQTKQPIFVAEQNSGDQSEPVIVKTRDFLSSQTQPYAREWTSSSTPFCSGISSAAFGAYVSCTIAVRTPNNESASAQGALVADLKLDPVFSQAATGTGSPTAGVTSNNRLPAAFIVLDRSGRILFHTNEALKHQSVERSMSHFTPIAKQMFANETGRQNFKPPDGAEQVASFTRIPDLDVSVAIASNRDLVLANARRKGAFGFVAALLLGILGAVMLTLNWQRKSRAIDRVTRGVEEIAKGRLDHRIELSSDDLRPLADNVGLVTEQLREQLAREAETKQFQSFVRLSAILTHDLKNAIEALSLTVTNMERHYENPEFRADAMKTLRSATGNLQALVSRLSNPVNTLSGEHKLPRAVDLVPMLKRVISVTAEPAKVAHEVKIKLPEKLIALADVERMDKCVENLIINALESMSGKVGTLTIEAGNRKDGKPYFSVTDTGEGMSQRFIEERLFRPFATTKRKGVGLGLYTCREVVRANGGSIEVNSKEGYGTTFTVVLPSAALRTADKSKPRSTS